MSVIGSGEPLPGGPHEANRPLARQGIGIFATGVGVSAANFVTGVLVARLLGPEGRGEVAAALLYFAPLGFLAGLGIPQAHAFLVARTGRGTNAVYGNSLLAGGIAGSVFGAAGWILMPYLLTSQPADVVQSARWTMLTMPVVVVLGMILPVLQGLHRFELYDAHRILKTVGYVVALLMLWAMGLFTVSAVILVQVIIPLILSAAFLVWVRTRLNLKGFRTSAPLLREAVRFGFRAQVGLALALFNVQVPIAVVANRFDAASVGSFAVAISASGFLLALQNPFNLILMPAVAKRVGAGQALLIMRAIRLGLLFFGAFALGLIVLGDWLVRLLFGVEFTGAIGPMKITVVGYAALGLVDILDRACEGLYKPMSPGLGRAAGLVTMIVALVLFVPALGLNGAALAFTAGMLVNVFVMLLMLQRAGGLLGLRHLIPRMDDVRLVVRAVRYRVPPGQTSTSPPESSHPTVRSSRATDPS